MRMQRSGGILLLAVMASLNAAAAPLTATEQRIVAEVKAQSAAALALLETSVNINSGTMNPAGVREVGVLYRKEFDQLGFTTRWIDMPPAMQRAGHLLATRDGKQGKRLLLLGHLDTVFEADSPVQKWVRNGDRVRGQGVSDMKGGNMVIVQALRALQRAGVLDNTNITVLFTGDEENAGDPKSVSRGDMVDLAKRSDAVLSFEAQILAADGRATGTVGRRASSSFALDIKGKQGHSSGIFSQGSGYGAVYEAARVLDGFRQQVIEPGLTFNPGVILGGTDVNYDPSLSRGNAFGKTNVIANAVTIKGDLRYLDYPQRDRAHVKMRDIAAASLPGTSATVSFGESYPPMAVTPGNLKLLALYSQASDDAGLGTVDAVPAEARGAGDIQFAAPFVDSLDGLGVSGNGAHSPSEDLEVATLERAAIRAALMLYRLTR
jgi:glutamate carboxypeptidase